MALTSDQWRKIKDNSQAYGSLTEQNKKKFWEFGVSNGLVDFQNLKPDNINKLTERFGVTKDYYNPKYLKKPTEAVQSEIQNEELKYSKKQSGMVPTGAVNTGDKGKAVVLNQSEIDRYNEKLALLSGDQRIAYEKAEKRPVPIFEQEMKPQFKPITPYTTNPINAIVKPQLQTAQTQSPNAVPTIDSRFSLANRQQNLKESALDTPIPQVNRTLSSRLQEDFGTLAYNRPQNRLEAGAYGVAEGIKGAFGGNLLRTQEEKRIYDEANRFKGITLPAVQGGGLSNRLEEDFGQSKSTESTDISARDLGQGFGRLGAEVGKYAIVAPVLATTKIGKGIITLAEKLGLGKFAQNQILDAFTDMAIQTPSDLIESIENDDSASDFVKKWLANRALDVAMNYGIGKGLSALEGALKTKSVNGALTDAGVTANEIRQAVEANDKTLIDQIRDKLNITAVEGETIVKQGIEPPSLLQRARTASGVNPFGDATVQQAKQITPKLEPQLITTPVNAPIKPVLNTDEPKVTPTLKPFNQTDDFITQGTGATSAKSVPYTVSNSTQSATELKEMVKNLDAQYSKLGNIEAEQMAKQIVDNNLENTTNMILGSKKISSDMESELARQAVLKYQEQGNFEKAFELIDAVAEKAVGAGRFNQLFRLWSKSTPEGMVKYANKTLKDAGVEVDPEFMKQINKQMTELNSMDAEGLTQRLLESTKGKGLKYNILKKTLGSESFERLKELNIALVMGQVTDKIPVSLGKKLSTFQAISHLLNATTTARNLIGNVSSLALEGFSMGPSKLWDMALSAKTGSQKVSVKGPKWKTAFGEGVEGSKRSINEILLDANLDKGKYELFKGPSFKNVPVLSQLEKALSLTLKMPDEFFKGVAKTSSLASNMRLRLGDSVKDMSFDELVNKATRKELADAEAFASYATFQNDSLPAQMLTDAKKVLNKVGIGGKGFGKTKDFGLGDLVVKYTRVPGNLIARGIEYSPVGYLKTLSVLAKSKGLNEASQKELAHVLGRATTGTGIMAMGMWLGSLGVITSSNKDKSYDLQKLQQGEGLGNYQINVSAIDRAIQGKPIEIKKGDNLVSYSFLEPLNSSLAIGASIDKELKTDKSAVEKVQNIAMRTVEEQIDIPSLYIIQKLMYELQGDSENKFLNIAAIPFTESASGFVPSVVRQTAQTIDPVLRVTKDSNKLVELKNKVQANIPGLSKFLPPVVNTTGTEAKRDLPLQSLLSPSRITTYNPTGYTNELMELEKLTGDKGVYPSYKAQATISNDKQNYKLTQQEQSDYMKIAGTRTDKMISALLKGVKLSEMSTEELETLAKLIKAEDTKSREIAKESFLKSRGLK